ncbi:MAG TPA: hypothetical protein VHR86_01790 [Armatimonadota bacterium]|nr:hypothetical protein [Armatimonadota bacterium]
MAKTILLLSGGLDSTRAGKMLLDMGIEVEGLNLTSPFCRCTPSGLGCSAASKAASQLGITVKVIPSGNEYLEIVKHPRFGRGSGANACIDCRVHLFGHAARMMRETGADFITTGDVLDERPMSQRKKVMELIERQAGLEGYVLRPLSARHLAPTVAERTGLVDREKLLAIHGRRRLPQMALAEELGIGEYLCPAGGCLLTDPEYAVRFKELLDHDPGFGIRDANLLKLGRHLRLPSGAKVVIGRNEQENTSLRNFLTKGDVLIETVNVPGPSVLCRCPGGVEDIRVAMAAAAAYTKHCGKEKGIVTVTRVGEGGVRDEVVSRPMEPPLDAGCIARWWVGTEHTRSIMERNV